MTKSNPHASAPKSLASLQIDTNPRAVIDEISALRLHRPSAVDYAAFVNNPACIADMVERARLHADQVARFITLAQVSPPNTVTRNLHQLYALVLLNVTATVAVAIMPAHNGPDRHARCQQGAAFIQSLENPDENELRDLAEIAFELTRRDAHTISRDAIAFASRGHGEEAKPSRATIHWIEENATLRNWLKRRTEVSVLLAEARQHAIMLDRFEASFDQDDLPPIARDGVAEACEGALHQHVLALAELALSPVAVTTDQILEAAHASVATRTKLQAGLLIAIAVGHHYRAMLAANPC